MSVLSTVTRAFKRYGQPVAITRSGSTHTSTGFIVPLDSATQNTFFDGNEAVGLTKPGYVLFVAGSDPNPPLLNDIFFTSDGDAGTGQPRQLTVRKVQGFRVSNVLVVWECPSD